MSYKMPNSFIKLLKEKDEVRSEVVDARREQKVISEAEASIAVFNAGAVYWVKVLQWAEGNSDTRPSDLALLKIASAMPKRLPSGKDSVRLFEIKAMFEDSVRP